MRKLYGLLFLIIPCHFFAQNITVDYTVDPLNFEQTDDVVFIFNIDEAEFEVQDSHNLYLWAWSLNKAGDSQDAPTNHGDFNVANDAKLEYRSSEDGMAVYTFTMSSVEGFYDRTETLSEIGLLIKNADGSKQSQDIILEVGQFKFNLQDPAEGSKIYADYDSDIKILAEASLPSVFEITENDSLLYKSTTASTDLDYIYVVRRDAQVEVKAVKEDSEDEITRSFQVRLNAETEESPIPDYMRQGISYDSSDDSKAGLAIYAPGKDFVHVIGSFNDWKEDDAYLMKRDTDNPDLFWLEIEGLTPGEQYTFQYSLSDGIKTADPYSPVVLSPNDRYKVDADTYPDLPGYPEGQEFDVSVMQTGQRSYEWEVPNFDRPKKEDLVVYELLIRDFTEEANWKSLIDKIPYLKALNINAVEIMPIMEFDANTSWGYDTAFHYALDKSYGTAEHFKEFIDESHKNGIAVILDIALNHATSRNPLVRMWMDDPSGLGFGTPSADNPYFNRETLHAYGVFNDFNHSTSDTHYYVNRVLEHWITEYNIDGFRWDLTKGFTQNCTEGDEDCTNAYQQDRVDIMKRYADYQWDIDEDSYIVFEHLGTDQEEQEWANYRLNEGKGVMMWNKMTDPYNQNTMGYDSDSNFDRVDFSKHGFEAPRAMNYGESHDEERLMFKNLEYGNANTAYNVQDLSTALERQKAYGAVFLTLPGPKMILQFAELGYDLSIYTCADGSVDLDSGDCRLDKKPSAFELGYDTDPESRAVYDTWAQLLDLRLNNEVFETSTFEIESGNLLPRIYIYNENTSKKLDEVIILANFDIQERTVNPRFTEEGIWYDLMAYSKVEVEDKDMALNLAPGAFKILGNALPDNVEDDEDDNENDWNIDDTGKTHIEPVQNPVVDGVARLAYNNAAQGIISIYNLGGKLVKRVNLKDGEGTENIPVDNLSVGVYFVQLKANQGVSETKIIIGR